MRKKIGYRLTLSVGTHTVYDDTFATSTEAKRLGAQMVYDQFAKTHGAAAMPARRLSGRCDMANPLTKPVVLFITRLIARASILHTC